MTVREILNILPKFTTVDIFDRVLLPKKMSGCAFQLLESYSDILDAEVLHMDPGNRDVQILIEPRHKHVGYDSE